MTIGPFGGRVAEASGRAGEIKAWVSQAFGLEEGTVVTVVELRCTEPECLPVETVIVILWDSGGSRRYKMHKPISEVTSEDIRRLADEEKVAGSKEEEA